MNKTIIKMDLRGIVTVINTPFRYNGEIDQNGLRKHLRYAIDSGVKVFDSGYGK